MHKNVLSTGRLARIGLATLTALAFGTATAQEAERQSYFSLSYTSPQPGDSSPQRIDLWERIRSGLKLEPLNSPLVQVHADWLGKRPDYLARMLKRSGRYLFHIVEEVEARGMPMEIALLPMVESGFNPQAYSRSHAAGIWQFIPSTGRLYGLDQNHWYDGRRDVAAATQAALDYLQKLFIDFGSWELALAAYNCGEGCVSRAIRQNAQRGLPTDYVNLPLPGETRHYVPKLMAFKQMVLAPESFGVALNDIPNQPYFTQVSLNGGAIDVRSAARLAGLSVDEFLALNPAFPRKLIKTNSQLSVLVPVAHAELFQNNIEKGDWDRWQPVMARKGMTPAEIARQFGTSVSNLAEHNQLHLANGRLIKDQVILAPVGGAETTDVGEASWQQIVAAPQPAEQDDNRARYHRVRQGETLATIARHYQLSAATLKRLNQLRSTRVKPGQRLLVKSGDTRLADAGSARAAKAGAAGVTGYTVRRGDTLAAIAARFKVSVAEIKAWNQLRGSRLEAGKRLHIHRG